MVLTKNTRLRLAYLKYVRNLKMIKSDYHSDIACIEKCPALLKTIRGIYI